MKNGNSSQSFERLSRNLQRRDGLSSSLQLAKAGEHLVCCELILQGWNAILADAGLPYDVLVDVGAGKFLRVQVKSTSGLWVNRGKSKSQLRKSAVGVYVFAMRRSRTGNRRISLDAVDVMAFVALDIRRIAFAPVAEFIGSTGQAVATAIFKSRRLSYPRGLAGLDPMEHGRFIEDYPKFDAALTARKRRPRQLGDY